MTEWAMHCRGVGAVLGVLTALLITPSRWAEHHSAQWFGIALAAAVGGAAAVAVIGGPGAPDGPEAEGPAE